tara:strand:+ start:682 stop:1869 length:1188 start_codon:yes stop_codon:yes gene_type:complete
MDSWSDEEDVTMFAAFMDAGQPYSCTQWGNNGINGMPVITDDGNGFGNHMWNWFNLGGYVPSNVFIDHTMTVFYKMNGLNTGLGNTKVQQMLTACEDAGLCGCSGPDSDNDGTPDQCDDCLNLAGDVNDDLTVDILDIISVVNMILNGGINSPNFTDCEKEDGDFNSDLIINVLDIIAIINNILGSRPVDVIGDANVIINNDKNNTYIRIISDVPYTGIEFAYLSNNNPSIKLKDNSHISIDYLNNNNVTRMVAYSIINDPFDGYTSEFVIENDIVLLDEISVLIGSVSGHELDVSYSTSNEEFQYGPYAFELKNVVPNPFNPVTQIEFALSNDGFVNLSAFNLKGQEVDKIFVGFQSKGLHNYTWDASDFPSGIYYIQLRQGNKLQTTKAILMK